MSERIGQQVGIGDAKESYRSLRARVEILTRERDEARAALESMQWCAEIDGFDNYCPACARSKGEGHNSVCRIARALGASA
jgi:hypothetical protein